MHQRGHANSDEGANVAQPVLHCYSGQNTLNAASARRLCVPDAERTPDGEQMRDIDVGAGVAVDMDTGENEADKWKDFCLIEEEKLKQWV